MGIFFTIDNLWKRCIVVLNWCYVQNLWGDCGSLSPSLPIVTKLWNMVIGLLVFSGLCY